MAETRPDSARKEVVVVDDDRDIRTALLLALEREGFAVRAFGDGQDALEGITEPPALVLLDYMMPRLNAAGFLRQRKQHQALKDTPVVVISAYPELADLVASETVGLLHKPIDLDILVECVNYHCSREDDRNAGPSPRPSRCPR